MRRVHVAMAKNGLGLVILFLLGPSLPVAADPVVVGYYTSWSIYGRDYQVEDLDAARLTHVNYAFSNIDATTGTCVLGDPWADVDRALDGDCWDPGCLRGNFRRFQLLKEAHPHLKLMISIGGWTWSSAFSQVAATEESRRRFAESCIDLYVRGEFGGSHGTHPGIFDGIDVDWEFPVSGGPSPGRPEDTANFTLLMTELREQLDALSLETGADYELSIAAGPAPSHRANLDIAGLAAVLDHVDVMAYDYHGGWEATSNFNAPLQRSTDDPVLDPAGFSVAESIDAYLAAGVPPEKLVMGLPLYGRCWSGVPAAGDGLHQPASGTCPGTWEPGNVDYWDVVANHLPTATRHFHERARVPWLHAGDLFISYDDAESFREKAALACERGLAGVMLWELSGDLRDRDQSLLAVLEDALCPDAVALRRIDDLRLARDGDDLHFTWTLDPAAAGGHRVYSTDRVEEARGLRGPAHSPIVTLPVGAELPLVHVGGAMRDGVRLRLFQVLSVAADGVTEGPG
ncbi:MAG: glycoside hydrolase family 18 protein [Acidobacteriota bacterium]